MKYSWMEAILSPLQTGTQTVAHFISLCFAVPLHQQLLRFKCDGTRAETRFRLSAKRTSPLKLVWASVQSTTGSRGVRISGSNAGYTMFGGSVKSTGYPLHSPVSPSLPLPVRHRVPSHFNWTLPVHQQLLQSRCFSLSRGFQTSEAA
jgi:hypothetical protein